MLICLGKTFKLKFDGCQFWMHQIFCCDLLALKLLASDWQLECNVAKVPTDTKRDSLHLIPRLIISAWLWILSILPVNFASSVIILPVWSSQRNPSAWPPYKGCWEISLSIAGALFDNSSNGARQQAHPTIAELPPHPQIILDIGKSMLQNRIRSMKNTGTCYPSQGWFVSPGEPDNPALARVACPVFCTDPNLYTISHCLLFSCPHPYVTTIKYCCKMDEIFRVGFKIYRCLFCLIKSILNLNRRVHNSWNLWSNFQVN